MHTNNYFFFLSLDLPRVKVSNIDYKALFLLTLNSLVPLFRTVIDKWWSIEAFTVQEFNKYSIAVTVYVAISNFLAQYILHKYTYQIKQGFNIFDLIERSILYLGFALICCITISLTYYLGYPVYWIGIGISFIMATFFYAVFFGILILRAKNQDVVVANLLLACVIGVSMLVGSSLALFLVIQVLVSIVLILIYSEKNKISNWL